MNSSSDSKRRQTIARRVFRWGVLIVAGAYVLFCVWFYLFQESVLFRPEDEPTQYVAKPSLQLSVDVLLEPPEAKIHVQKFDTSAESRRGTIFYLHGNRGNLEQCRWAIEPLLDAGYDVWAMDYRGFGESTGRPSESALLADAQMVYKRIREETDERKMIVWGRSFGSGIAAYLASINSPKAVVLETPYWSLPDAGRHRCPLLLPFLFRYRLPTNVYLGYVDCPVHLIHGTADEEIDFRSSKRLEKRCRELGKDVTLYRIDGGRHVLRGEAGFDAALEKILR
jgi:alpha-beta hydrolase superfamily lysophospholipase